MQTLRWRPCDTGSGPEAAAPEAMRSGLAAGGGGSSTCPQLELIDERVLVRAGEKGLDRLDRQAVFEERRVTLAADGDRLQARMTPAHFGERRGAQHVGILPVQREEREMVQ